MKDARLDFRGEPLEGLADHGHTRIPGTGVRSCAFHLPERRLPAQGRPVQSMFPYELRKAHGLPDHGEKDSIYGYHFLRLLVRSSAPG